MRFFLMLFTMVWTMYASAKTAAVATIAPKDEPGTRIVVHGTVVDKTTNKPVPGVVVYAYHTDAKGLYNKKGIQDPRLRGWVTTDGNGRFELHTIRPGSYPGSLNPPHIHFELSGAGYPKQWDELTFVPLSRSKDAKITIKLKR